MAIYIVSSIVVFILYLYTRLNFINIIYDLDDLEKEKKESIINIFKSKFNIIFESEIPCLVTFFVYPIIICFIFSNNYCYEDFLTLKMLLWLGIPTIFITAILSFLLVPKCSELPNEIKKKRPFLKFTLIKLLLLISFNISCVFISFTNNAFNFSYELKVVTITNKSELFDYGVVSYFFDIEPSIYGLKYIQVPMDLYSEYPSKKKLRLRVYDGLYGFHYIGKEMEMIREDQ